jgi:PAS domain S-box-containing protein
MAAHLTAELSSEHDRSFEDLVSNMNLVAVMLNTRAEITYCNDYFLRLTDWTLPEVLGCSWYERFVPPSIDDLRGVFSDLLKDLPNAWHHENEILCRSHEKVLIRWNNATVRNSSGQVIGIASIGDDITERRLLERELLEGSTRERRHLAAELHDGLGQNLYGASLLIQSIEATARRAGLGVSSDLVHLASIVGASIDTCRSIAQGLSPLANVRGGIIQALRELTQMPTSFEPQVSLTITDAAPLRINTTSLDHLYRLAQEALSNALKHASATSIRVSLNIQPASVTLTVADDGIGLPPRAAASKRLGLKLMRYRANIIHAKLTISGNDPHGTRITCECPQGRNP